VLSADQCRPLKAGHPVWSVLATATAAEPPSDRTAASAAALRMERMEDLFERG
jgi:hypothetical protein